MIHSSHRFHGRSSLRFVYQRGEVVRGPLVSLRHVQNSRRTTYRVAVVVSRKVSKSAVVRNRIRRRIYEIVRKNSQLIVGSHDLVFNIYGEDVAKMSHASLQKALLGLLWKAGASLAATASGAEHDILDEKETNI
jgi:ribonuclease P protein component